MAPRSKQELDALAVIDPEIDAVRYVSEHSKGVAV